MIRVVQLMTEKNHFLEKFMALNERQIERLEAGYYDQIEAFYNQREDLIKIISYIDSEMNKEQLNHRDIGGVYTEVDRAAMKDSLRVKDNYVACIIDQDMQVLALIDQAKSDIIKELHSVRLAKKAMGGYKTNAA